MDYTLLWTRLEGEPQHEAGLRLLRLLYRAETGEDIPEIARTATGKPYFVDAPWHFSVSHTNNHAFCVLGTKRLGVDAEEQGRIVSEKMAQRFLSPQERERLGEDRQDALLRLWVLKEALAKCCGRGIGNWLKTTDLDPFDERLMIIDGCYVAVMEE